MCIRDRVKAEKEVAEADRDAAIRETDNAKSEHEKLQMCIRDSRCGFGFYGKRTISHIMGCHQKSAGEGGYGA